MESIILQIIVFQLCFLLIYEVLLKKETFFNWNRVYLLSTSILSLVLPFIKLKSFSKVIPNDFFVNLPTVILGETEPINTAFSEQLDTVVFNSESEFSIVWLWYLGILFYGGLLLYKLIKIWKYKQSNVTVKKNGYSIITLKNSEDAFSFLNSIFLGDRLENEHKESVLKHEKVHAKEKHTIDLLWFELLRIVFWFNPLVYIYQKRITEVHEFIADKSASKYQTNYYENLLAKTFNVAQFSVVNQFYSSSLIKKRIIMLTKEKSNKILKLKYLLIAPVVAGMLVFASCENKEVEIISGNADDRVQAILDEIKTKIETADGDSTREERIAYYETFLQASNNIRERIENPDATNKDIYTMSTVDTSPIFPGCSKDETPEELKKCMSVNIAQFVNNNFNTKLADLEKLKGKQKIAVAFKISDEGLVTDIKVRAEHPVLIEEAKRVIKLLPRMEPAKFLGKSVTVGYSLPIIFAVN